jgi:hypothetical protein
MLLISITGRQGKGVTKVGVKAEEVSWERFPRIREAERAR